MNNLVFEHEKESGGQSFVYTDCQEIAEELQQAFGNGARYPYPEKLVGWHFRIPTQRVEFYHRRFLALKSKNDESKGVEIEQLTETTSKPKARRGSFKSKPMHDKGSVDSRANLRESRNGLPNNKISRTQD